MRHNKILVEERDKVPKLEQKLERMKIAMDKEEGTSPPGQYRIGVCSLGS